MTGYWRMLFRTVRRGTGPTWRGLRVRLAWQDRYACEPGALPTVPGRGHPTSARSRRHPSTMLFISVHPHQRAAPSRRCFNATHKAARQGSSVPMAPRQGLQGRHERLPEDAGGGAGSAAGSASPRHHSAPSPKRIRTCEPSIRRPHQLQPWSEDTPRGVLAERRRGLATQTKTKRDTTPQKRYEEGASPSRAGLHRASKAPCNRGPVKGLRAGWRLPGGACA